MRITTRSHSQYPAACAPFAWRNAVHLGRTDVTKLLIVLVEYFFTPPGKLYAVGHCLTELDSVTNYLIESIPNVFYWEQIHGIYGPIKHTYVFVIETLCRRGRREVWHFCAGKWCCSGERKAWRSGVVSHRGIWQHPDYQYRHAVLCDKILPPKPVSLRRHVPPASDGDVSIPLSCTASHALLVKLDSSRS